MPPVGARSTAGSALSRCSQHARAPLNSFSAPPSFLVAELPGSVKLRAHSSTGFRGATSARLVGCWPRSGLHNGHGSPAPGGPGGARQAPGGESPVAPGKWLSRGRGWRERSHSDLARTPAARREWPAATRSAAGSIAKAPSSQNSAQARGAAKKGGGGRASRQASGPRGSNGASAATRRASSAGPPPTVGPGSTRLPSSSRRKAAAASATLAFGCTAQPRRWRCKSLQFAHWSPWCGTQATGTPAATASCREWIPPCSTASRRCLTCIQAAWSRELGSTCPGGKPGMPLQASTSTTATRPTSPRAWRSRKGHGRECVPKASSARAEALPRPASSGGGAAWGLAVRLPTSATRCGWAAASACAPRGSAKRREPCNANSGTRSR
mmetsp:Transcript_81535/g.264158  ORF Transcript_81535/g.264158 Transcript_81535/m.264158 type:complete len:383 (-) Transcript_81535:812-1960(-)